MTEVACFCGCLFSFDGGADACPRCGEFASVTDLDLTDPCYAGAAVGSQTAARPFPQLTEGAQ
jgi:hypothetical protein